MRHPVTITVTSAASARPKEFDFVTEASTGEVSIVYHIEKSVGEWTLKMRRLRLFNWWPARQIQLFMVRKAFKSNQ